MKVGKLLQMQRCSLAGRGGLSWWKRAQGPGFAVEVEDTIGWSRFGRRAAYGHTHNATRQPRS